MDNYVDVMIPLAFLAELREHIVEGDLSRRTIINYIDNFSAQLKDETNYQEEDKC